MKGNRFRCGATTRALLLLTIVLAAGLVWGVAGRKQSAFAVQRIATAEVRRLPDGSTAQPWRAIIGNRSETVQTYEIRLAGTPGSGVELLGPLHDISVEANQHREISFMIHTLQPAGSPQKLQLQLIHNGSVTAAEVISP